MSKIDSIIRTLIREMALGGIQTVTGKKPGYEKIHRSPLTYSGPYVEKQMEPKRFKRYYESQLFTKRAESYFRNENWPYPVYLFPFVGLLPKIPNMEYYPYPGSPMLQQNALFSDRFNVNRIAVMSMDEGEPYLTKLGFDSRMIEDRSGLAIMFTSTSVNPSFFATLWMVIHTIFDVEPDEIFPLSPKFVDLVDYNPLVTKYDKDGAPPRLASTFTMESAKNQTIPSADDAIAEAMTQELIQRHNGGFRFNDEVMNSDMTWVPITDEERSILEELKLNLMQARDEFIQNCRGKMIFVRTS